MRMRKRASLRCAAKAATRPHLKRYTKYGRGSMSQTIIVYGGRRFALADLMHSVIVLVRYIAESVAIGRSDRNGKVTIEHAACRTHRDFRWRSESATRR